MEFFGILHCVQDDSNYKDYCNKQLRQQIPFEDDKQNGISRLGGRMTSQRVVI